MKLGKELCSKVCAIPKSYMSTISELLDMQRTQVLESMAVCPAVELESKQKELKAIDSLKKALSDARKEADLYKN
tara:strand:+ start:5506 stop:5730 length:225 start_codon:yes stop_codon:yes gene_type:complete